jgi:hypothetical protein
MTSLGNHSRLVMRVSQFNAIDVLCVVVLVAYFLHFALPAVGGGFPGHDMMNMYTYWVPGMLKSLRANICFWTSFYRPGGALYYLPLYHLFGLNPQPYRIVQVSILAVSIPVVYYLARLLGSSQSVAFVAVLGFSYHPQLADLVFTGPYIYDALCGFFYFSALTFYIRIREKGCLLRPMQCVGFLTLYIGALNAKEMAVTLPVIVLIYEVLKLHRFGEWKQFARRNWRSALPSLIAGLLTAVYIYGKTHGANSFAKANVYRLDYSWHSFTASNAHFIDEIFYQLIPNHIAPGVVLFAAWGLVFAYAFLRRDRLLQLMAFWVVITPLPLDFITIRGDACLYIPLFGWAMILAKVVSDSLTLISKSFITVDRRGAEVARQPAQSLGRATTKHIPLAPIGTAAAAVAGKMSPSMLRAFAVLLVACGLAVFTQWENQRFDRVSALLNSGQKALRVIQALRSLNLHPAPDSTILLRGWPYRSDPFWSNGWNTVFIASLVYNDHSLRICHEGTNQLTQKEIGKMDYIISVDEFHAELSHSPTAVRADIRPAR